MILFLNDWFNLHPEAIIDYQTKNESFVKLARKYKEMGIKNHSFILALLNPELQGVDPHDPNLTFKQKQAIVVECKLNFWYFLREVVRVPAGSQRVYFKANRGNIAAFWLFFNHITFFLQQLRQTGKSLVLKILSQYLVGIHCQDTVINYITLNNKKLSDNLKELRKSFELLPEYLNVRTNKDIGNTEKLTVNVLGNVFQGYVPNADPDKAEEVGRGFTSPVNVADETPYLTHIQIILPVMLSSGIAARDIARENMDPYGTILASTAGDPDTAEGAYIYKMIMGWAQWTEHFFDCDNLEQLEEVIRKASSPETKELAVFAAFSYKQLGYSDEWMKRVLEETKAKGDIANRDLFGIWQPKKSSKLNPIDKDVLQIIIESKDNDLYSQITENSYIIRWYIPEKDIQSVMDNTDISLGTDTSDAIGRDELTIHGRNIETGATVFVGNYNETNLHTFARWIGGLLIKYKRITWVPERKYNALAIIDVVCNELTSAGIDPFRRIYNSLVNDCSVNDENYIMLNKSHYSRPPYFYDQHRKTFGFSTSGAGVNSRKDLYGIVLSNAAKYTGSTVKDEKLIFQISNLEERNGRVDHKHGGNDDLVISWLLSYWLITYGRNLSMYGINTGLIMKKNPYLVKEVKAENTYEYLEQQNIRSEMQDVYQKLLNTNDAFLTKRYEILLRKLYSKLQLGVNEMFSIEEVIKNAKNNAAMSRYQ